MQYRLVFTLLVLLLALPAIGAPITTGTLVDEMIDMHRLTYFPDPAYKTIQFSSYDRTSALPNGPGWFANSDGFGEEPTPNFEQILQQPGDDKPGEYLICDVEGPGAIVRLWTADIGGVIRVYLDGDSTAFYDGPAADFFRKTYDAFLEGITVTPELLQDTFYQRNASYTPIPFAKHCRIVWIGNHKEIHFYEVQMRLYDKSAVVQTFSTEDLKAFASNIRHAAEVLKDVDANWTYRATSEPAAINAAANPGEMKEALKLEGTGAIERLTLQVQAGDIDKALRQTILHIHCDGAPWGQVQAPIGDFFGAAPGINPYTSVPFTVAADGAMTSRYVTPYKQSLRIFIENKGEQPVTVTGSALAGDYEWDDARSMHFRARWRVDHDLIADGAEERGAQDLPFLVAQGKGLYAGTSVMLLNPNTIPTPWGNWWGEGDEKIFVDGEARPSTYGTGSEDYFNYAWSATDLFMFPYCGQPRNDGPGNNFFVTNYRWHIIDPLPFQQGIAFYMELFSHERTAGFSCARIAYHYAMPGMIDDHRPITGDNVRALARPANWEPVAKVGASNSTFYGFETLPKSGAPTEIVQSDMWQGGQLLVWSPAKEGDAIEFAFEVGEAGEYNVALVCRHEPNGGSFLAELDGKPLTLSGGEPIKLVTEFQPISRPIGGASAKLEPGKHTLTLKAVQAGAPIGLDFLWLQKRGK